MNRRGWRSDRPLLICYAALGDPQHPADALAIYARHGVDVVEVGVPNANPHLDGPTVAESMRRSLHNPDPIGTIRANIDTHARFIHDGLRVVLMGYRDMPFQSFTPEARRHLLHGVIIADTSTEGDPVALSRWLDREGVKRIGFVDSALSTHLLERARRSEGYVMLQAHAGPTGVRVGMDARTEHRLRELRCAQVDLPIALGFGIGTQEQAAAAIGMGADGVVVGSACIEAGRRGPKALARFVADLRAAIDRAWLSAGPG